MRGFDMRTGYIISPGKYEWKTDPVYLKFQADVLYGTLTFEGALKWTEVEKWSWLNKEWKTTTKKEWERLSRKWKRNNNFGENDALKGFAAITLIYSSLPYYDLNRDEGDVSEFLATMINRCIYQETRHLLAGTMFRIEENLLSCPVDFADYDAHIDNLYNSASWWLCFLIFESHYRKGVHSVVITRPVQWLI